MDVRSGVDIFLIKRMKQVLDENNQIYLKSVFTAEEQAGAKTHEDVTAYFATRFAAKEAVFKTLCITWEEDMEWSQIEILRCPAGNLSVELHARLGEVWRLLGRGQISVSVSWDTDYAIAVATALLETESELEFPINIH